MKTSKQRSNSKGPIKVHISWDEYKEIVEKLCENIKDLKLPIVGVYGVPRGGLIPAVMVSHILGIKYYHTLEGGPPRKGAILIVDDITDTGKTFIELFKKYLADWKYSQFVTAPLYKHKNSSYSPTLYVEENSNWIVFPYERD